MRWKTITWSLKFLVVAASFTLAAAWSALWVRSYSASDQLQFTSPHGMTLAYTCRGGVGLLTQPFVTPPGWEWDHAEFGNPPEPYQAGFGRGEETWFGIRRGSYFTGMAQNAWAIAVPLRLFIVVSLLPTAAAIVHAFTKRIIRRRRGRRFEVTDGLARNKKGAITRINE